LFRVGEININMKGGQRMTTDSKIISFNSLDEVQSDITKLGEIVDKLLVLGDKFKANRSELEYVQEQLRRQELNSNFYTMDEVAEALHCEKGSAIKTLRNRGVELISSGKSFVVQRDNFLNAFRN
jgi:hypothetical protein